ncbi:MAG: Hint domain-containing protein, partial [Pseudomonadota bacterium]
MPDGYLVQLGDGSLDAGDLIVDPLVTFTTDQVLGSGNWEWSGTFGGTTFTNESEPGDYILATDGNVYFVPSFGPVTTITSATVTSAPTFSALMGTPDPDDIDGTANDDFIDGLGSNDTIDGFGGNDTINAGEGDDIVDGGTGDDLIDGEDGADSLLGDAGNDTILGGDGNDTIDGGANNDSLDGEAGDDEINGGTGNDTILGGGGADLLDGDGGADSVDGGDGNDTIEGGGGGDTVVGGAGDDELDGQGGADVLVGGSGNDSLEGGTGNDTIYGDQEPGAPASELLDWSAAGGNGEDVSGGFTQVTGTTEVTVSVTNDGALTSAEVDTGTTQYTEAGEAFGTNSALELVGNGGANTSTVNFSFASSDDGDTENVVENVSFRLNDVDTGSWTDSITINAIDADGNPVIVEITAEDALNTTSGNTVTAGVANGGADDASGSVLVEIAGPLASFEIIYGNDNTGGQRAWVSDISFDPIPLPDGEDTLIGGTGADEMFGGGGNDSFVVSDGDSATGGAGDDLFTLTDLAEANAAIFIDGSEDGETGGDTIALNGQAALSDVVYDVGNPENGTITLTDGTLVTFSNIENIICFTPGTMIATPYGARAIETLVAGDLVLTRDHGPQPLRWIGQRTVPAEGRFAPIEVGPGVLGEGSLLVSPQHRMLFSGYRAELLFGESEVLVAAKHLVDGQAVRVSPRGHVTYIHMMFDAHQIITANGLLTESFLAADQGLAALDDGSRDELFEIFPELRSSTVGPSARRSLKAFEAALLAA